MAGTVSILRCILAPPLGYWLPFKCMEASLCWDLVVASNQLSAVGDKKLLPVVRTLDSTRVLEPLKDGSDLQEVG